MLDVYGYTLFVLAIVGLHRYVMRGVEREGGVQTSRQDT